MLIKFFARGTGGGSGPVEYITRQDNPLTGELRQPAQEVIRGHPDITRRLIDSLDFKHKYRSGVLSFAPSDNPTDKDIESIIDDFESYAFAGLEKDAYNTLWVKHTHTGNNRVELHFVTPRVELTTGKSLNIAPPGWHSYFKPWQTKWNLERGWARPDDPARKREVEPGFIALINAQRLAQEKEPLPDTKKLLTELVKERITAGLINNRDEMIDFFQSELGLKITRAGKNYITVQDPLSEKRYRLKGKLYEREFRPESEITGETNSGEGVDSTTNEKELRTIRARIKNNYQYRYSYNQTRYGASNPDSNFSTGEILSTTRPSRVESYAGYFYRQLGNDAILERSSTRESENIGFNRPTDKPTVSGIETAGRNSRVARRADRGDSHNSNRQRDISDSTNQLHPNQWLEMSGSTLSQIGVENKKSEIRNQKSEIRNQNSIGVEDERTRKKINLELQRSGKAIQAGYSRLINQVQRGYESVGAAEQAASTSSDGLTTTSTELERSNRELQQHQQILERNLRGVRGALNKKRERELERFKTEINLVEYARHQGYEYISSKSNRNSAVLRHEGGDKIIVATDTDGHGIYFSVRDDNDNGSIIDFVQKRNNWNLGEVRKELRPWLKEKTIIDNRKALPYRSIAKPSPVNRDRLAVIRLYAEFSAPSNQSYLTRHRGIAVETINSERFAIAIAIDSKNNVIFPHYDGEGLTGYEIKNVDFTGFSKGGTKALWQSNQKRDDKKLVITESAIDALSYQQLFDESNTRYLATGGSLSETQKGLIREVLASAHSKGLEIIIATDNDEGGEKLKDELIFLAPKDAFLYRSVPSENTKDWNELLKSLQLQEKKVQQSQQRKNRGGFSL